MNGGEDERRAVTGRVRGTWPILRRRKALGTGAGAAPRGVRSTSQVSRAALGGFGVQGPGRARQAARSPGQAATPAVTLVTQAQKAWKGTVLPDTRAQARGARRGWPTQRDAARDSSAAGACSEQ